MKVKRNNVRLLRIEKLVATALSALLFFYLDTVARSDNDLGTVELKTLDWILELQDFLDPTRPQVPYPDALVNATTDHMEIVKLQGTNRSCVSSQRPVGLSRSH